MMLATSISLSGLQAQQLRLHGSAHNVANLLTDDFKSQRIDLVARPQGGVQARVSTTDTPGPPRFDPVTGDLAGEDSNTDMVHEVVTLITSQRAYEANLAAIRAENQRVRALLDQIG